MNEFRALQLERLAEIMKAPHRHCARL